MREILFRGFGECGWSYGSLIYSPKEDQYYIAEHCDEELWFPVDKETVCEFTGLKDKNGKEIFEGDIVKFYNDLHEIVWGADGNAEGYTVQGFGCRHIKGYNGTMTLRTKQNIALEVIGNKWDNPELLEG